MTDIGGTKTVYAPVTPSVDNKAKPASGTSRGAVGAGLLQPSPNTARVRGVVKKDAETMTKREAFIAANGGLGDRGQYLENQKDAASSQQFPRVQQAQQEEGPVGLSTINNAVEDARDSSERSLDTEAKHDDQVAQAKEEALQKLHNEDLVREKKAQELAATQA